MTTNSTAEKKKMKIKSMELCETESYALDVDRRSSPSRSRKFEEPLNRDSPASAEADQGEYE